MTNGIVREVTIGPCRLICADCMDVLPTLSAVDAVVTDPPYGIDYEHAGGFSEAGGWVKHDKLGWDKERPSSATFNALLATGSVQVIWGGNYFADLLPPKMRWLIWDKCQANFSLADCEMAWTSQQKATRRIVIPRGVANKEPRLHWTQKPTLLMVWSMDVCCNGLQTVLDPFMGSGTTGVACIKTGRRFIGIEREPKYFDIACRRIAQAWQLKCSELPFDEPPKLRQRELLEEE